MPELAPQGRPALQERIRASIEKIGEKLVAFFLWNGEMARLLGRAAVVGPRRPWGLGDISYQMFRLGIASIPLASMMAVFVGMILAWQFGEALTKFGAKTTLGYASSLALVRELVPSLLAVTVGSKMSTGMAAELGSMKVTEQIDAIAALGADPVKKLVWPRILAATFAMPLLVAWGNVLALLGGMFISDQVFEVSAGYFGRTYINELTLLDYSCSLVKGLTFGTISGIVGCHQGFSTKFGTEAVGQSTTDTVVATSVTVLIADFALTTMFLPV